MSPGRALLPCHTLGMLLAVTVLHKEHLLFARQPDSQADAQVSGSSDPIELGRDLFLHSWRPGDPLSHAGDGLGPMFNERSCVACHSQGGVGGGGPLRTNVEYLSVVERCQMPKLSNAGSQQQAATVHPDLLKSPTATVLHRSSTFKDYDHWRQDRIWLASSPDSPCLLKNQRANRNQEPWSLPASLKSNSTFALLSPPPLQLLHDLLGSNGDSRNIVGVNGTAPFNGQPSPSLQHHHAKHRRAALQLTISDRNPTSLFGAGLIDQIASEVIEAEARRQAARGKPRPGAELSHEEELKLPATGRVSRLEDGRIGRFGWKAQMATLSDFTLNACAVEIGLAVPGHPQLADPRQPLVAETGLDMDQDQSGALVAFVKQLPPPEQLKVRHAEAGESLFNNVGCAECHVRDLGNVQGVYSDLLLHDMGKTLTGPIYSFNADKGSGRTPATDSEWRTPPLWGVHDSPPYLHDGRATTLTEAIAAHAGQGARAADAFGSLSPLDKQMLMEFLNSLQAPKAAERAATARPRRLVPQASPPKWPVAQRGRWKS